MTPARGDELRLAFLLLSRLPAGRIAGTAPEIAASAWAWPIVGAAVGAIAALVLWLAQGLGLPDGMAAVLALAAGVLVTGALHEDGLADLADGFGGGRDPAARLAIMRDSRIGSYGVIALILAFGLRATGIVTLAGNASVAGSVAVALIGLGAASRAVLPAALLLMPPARGDGLGHAAAGHDPGPARVAALIGGLCLLPLGPGHALVVALAITVAAALTGALAMRKIGGQTGDVLGAVQQAGECAGWIALVALA